MFSDFNSFNAHVVTRAQAQLVDAYAASGDIEAMKADAYEFLLKEDRTERRIHDAAVFSAPQGEC